MFQNLAHARLFGNDHRHMRAHGFQRRNTKRLTHARHHIHIAHAKHSIYFRAFEKTRKVKVRAHTQGRHAVHNAVKHVARPGHDKVHTRVVLQNQTGGFHKIFRAFLVGYAPQKRYDFTLGRGFARGGSCFRGCSGFATLDRVGFARFKDARGHTNGFVYGGKGFGGTRLYGVIDRMHLFGRNTIAVNNNIAGVVAHGNNAVGRHHAATFDIKHAGIDVFAATVKFGGVYVNHQGFAAYLLGGNTGHVGKPIVGVNHVELMLRSHGGGHHRIAFHLFHQVLAILTRKLEFALGRKFAYGQGAALHSVVQGEIVVQAHVGNQVRPDFDVGKILPPILIHRVSQIHLHLVGRHHAGHALVFVAIEFGGREDDFRALRQQTATHAVARCSQAARDMGRELPTEHQYSHGCNIWLIRKRADTLHACDTAPLGA